MEIPQNRDQVRTHYMSKMLIKRDDEEYQSAQNDAGTKEDVNTEPEEVRNEISLELYVCLINHIHPIQRRGQDPRTNEATH